MNTYKTVEEFLNGLDETRRAQVQQLRDYIKEAEPSLAEHIKWNAPSYVKGNEDRITFNTVSKEHAVKLVFHMGATRKENKKAEPILSTSPIIEWVSDIRGYATFKSLEEIRAKEDAIKQTLRDWLSVS